jgi:hypothetical protein
MAAADAADYGAHAAGGKGRPGDSRLNRLEPVPPVAAAASEGRLCGGDGQRAPARRSGLPEGRRLTRCSRGCSRQCRAKWRQEKALVGGRWLDSGRPDVTALLLSERCQRCAEERRLRALAAAAIRSSGCEPAASWRSPPVRRQQMAWTDESGSRQECRICRAAARSC